jgi:hypothetical protein
MIIAPGQVSSEVLMASLGEACAAGDIRSMTHLLDNGASVDDFIVSGYATAFRRFRLVQGWRASDRASSCPCRRKAVFLSFSTTDCLVSWSALHCVTHVWLHLQSVQLVVVSFVYYSRSRMVMMDQLPCLSLPCMVNWRLYACC